MTQKTKMELAKVLFDGKIYATEEIAQKLGITEAILDYWIKKGGWDIVHKTVVTARDGRLLAFYQQLDALNEKIQNGAGYPTDKEAMIQRRLAASIAHLEAETDFGKIVKVGMQLCDWVAQHDRENAERVLALYDKFVKHSLKTGFPNYKPKERPQEVNNYAL